MVSSKYTHLFFDLDNTIWDFNSNSYDALQIALEKLGLLKAISSYADFFKIYSDVNDRLWEQYRQGTVTKKVLSIQRFEETFEKNEIPLTIGGAILNDSYLHEMPLQTRLIDGARELLDYLHGRYKMSIITNGFKEVQYHKIHRSELSKYFGKIFISEEVGAQKPERVIFEHAAKSVNARKKNSLMIGDSWDADILGAMNYGIDQIYFSPEFEKPDSPLEIGIPSPKNNTISNSTPYFNTHKTIKINFNLTTTTFINHLEEIFSIL